MRTVNKVILIGNVTKDPFIKTMANGKKVALFTVATNRHFKNAQGEVISEAEYTSCAAWGPLAEQSEQYLVKGKLVYIEGHLKTRTIDREDGLKLFKTEVVVSNLIFLNKRGDFEEKETHDESFLDDVDMIDLDDKF